jgi:ABC-type nitrate/sulfonate/bicarbonate transport system permease component
MSEIINNRADEDQRATVLSVATFLKSTPYIALAPIIGYLNTTGRLEYFLISWSLLIVIAIGMYLIAKKRDSVISLSD